MVNATFAGRKIKTRRLVKIDDIIKEPYRFRYIGNTNTKEVARPAIKYDNRIWYEFQLKNSNQSCWIDTCPHGDPGDILWVRETVVASETAGGVDGVVYLADKKFIPIENTKQAAEKWMDLKHFGKSMYRNVPSIFMPKWACRLWLKVISVRVERLYDISPGDAVDEGIEFWDVDAESLEGGELVADFKNYMWKDDEKHADYFFPSYASCIDSFMSLWKKINGVKSYEANPWVWVIEYSIHQKK